VERNLAGTREHYYQRLVRWVGTSSTAWPSTSDGAGRCQCRLANGQDAYQWAIGIGGAGVLCHVVVILNGRALQGSLDAEVKNKLLLVVATMWRQHSGVVLAYWLRLTSPSPSLHAIDVECAGLGCSAADIHFLALWPLSRVWRLQLAGFEADYYGGGRG